MDKLEPLRKVDRQEFLTNSGFQDIAERNLQVAAQICLDIGTHIISALGTKRPQDYKEVFLILAEEEVIPQDSGKKIAPLAGLRNILVRESLEVDPGKIYAYLQEISDFAAFAQYILKFVSKVESDNKEG